MRIALSRESDADREVSPLELFFDLVYVFAIGQLSHHLVAHVDLRPLGVAALAVLAIATAPLSMIVGIAAASAVLVAVAAADTVGATVSVP